MQSASGPFLLRAGPRFDRYDNDRATRRECERACPARDADAAHGHLFLQLYGPADSRHSVGGHQGRSPAQRYATRPAVRPRLRAVLCNARHSRRGARRQGEPGQHHLRRARSVERDDGGLRPCAELRAASFGADRRRHRRGRLLPAQPLDHRRSLSSGEAGAGAVDLLSRRDARRGGGTNVRRQSDLFLRLADRFHRHRPARRRARHHREGVRDRTATQGRAGRCCR